MKIIVEAPCRISLFGGSTDIPPYSTEHGGICINMAINIRQRIVLNDEDRWNLQLNDNEYFFRTILDEMIPGNSFGVEHEFNGAMGSGISSSASLAVALVGGINHYAKLGMNKSEIAERARDLEANRIGLFTGRQDQYASAYGGVNLMLFGKETSVIPLGRDFINPILPYMQLFHIGSERVASKILQDYKSLPPDRIYAMNRIKSLAYSAVDPIRTGDINTVAYLLKEAWEMKKMSSTGVSNDSIDNIYDLGLELGAMAGKILGAGGGGYMLFLVPPARQGRFRENIGLKWVDFGIDWQGLNCRIL